MFSQCFLVNKSAFRYIVLFGNCMDPNLSIDANDRGACNHQIGPERTGSEVITAGN